MLQTFTGQRSKSDATEQVDMRDLIANANFVYTWECNKWHLINIDHKRTNTAITSLCSLFSF